MFKYSKLAMTVGLSALMLTACGNDSLNEKTALSILQEKLPKGTEVRKASMCPENTQRKYKVNVSAFQSHPCGNFKMNDRYNKIFIDKYDLITFKPFKFIVCMYGNCGKPDSMSIISGINEEKLALIKGSNFMRVAQDETSSTIVIEMYDYEVDKIVDIRQMEDGSLLPDTSCSAKVEYNYKRSNFAPWGQEYLDTIKKPKETYTACFIKYEDGWRLGE